MSIDDGERPKAPASAWDARLIVGRRGIIEDIDAGGCALLGYAQEDVIGLHGSELVPADARPATAASLDRMRLGEISHREARLLHRDGTVFTVQVSAQRAPRGRLILSLRKLPCA